MNPEKITEHFPIKNGVETLFEDNKEFGSVGTKEEYSHYLESIFPESKIKEILWHASYEKFDTFDISLLGKHTDPKLIDHYGNGFYFSRDTNINERWERPFRIPAKVNYTEETENNYDAGTYVVIENPQNIHILGSRADIEDFKKFKDQK